MKAVIMAGGYGTRLKPLTSTCPKPNLPVLGTSCIRRIITKLRDIGIREMCVTVMYRSEDVRRELEGETGIVFFEEKTPLGTAGSVRNCSSFLDDDFLVISGDGVSEFDLSEAMAAHRASGGLVTIVTTQVESPLEYGIVLTDDIGRVTRFVEKPDWSRACSDVINTGIYFCSRKLLDRIPAERFSDFSAHVFPSLMKDGIPIYTWNAKGYWCDIGGIRSYVDCNTALLARQTPSLVTQSLLTEKAEILPPCWIGKNVVLGHCRIGPGCVLGDNVTVSDGAIIEGSVLFDGVTVGRDAVLHGAVASYNVRIQDRCRIGEYAAVGSECVLGVGTIVSAGSRIFPGIRIPEDSEIQGPVMAGYAPLRIEEHAFSRKSGEDFDLSSFCRIGACFAQLKGKEIAVGRGGENTASLGMAFSGGVLSSGADIYDLGNCELSLFRFVIRHYGFSGGAYLTRSEREVSVRLCDSDGLPLSGSQEKKLLNSYANFGEPADEDGTYRIFRGGATAYENYLRTFLLPTRPVMRVAGSSLLLSLLPGNGQGGNGEWLRVLSDRLRVESADRDPFDDDLVRVAVAMAYGKTYGTVRVPYFFPSVLESLGKQRGFQVERLTLEDKRRRRLFAMEDPNVQALVLLHFLDVSRMSFREFSATLPCFFTKYRDVPVTARKGYVMRVLSSLPGRMDSEEGVRIGTRNGSVWILPRASSNVFRVCSEAADFEQAEELCEFYTRKLKGLKPE